jgi:hypothetical protein
MKRIIVNLVSEQTTPNFLFIKEMMQDGDALLFISSKKFEERIDWIINALEFKNCKIDNIVLPDGVEEKWSQMITLIKEKLSKDHQYVVNLTCGTKYMISAVPKAFDGFNAEFFYIPFPKNIILTINADTSRDINYRMSVKEYFDCNNTSIPNHKSLSKNEEYTNSIFEKFVKGELDFDVIEKIRIGYRGKKINIAEIETKENTDEKPQINNLSMFLSDISFPFDEADSLTKDNTRYLTGGWFEEYVYSLIKNDIEPQDILLGVDLPIAENRRISNRDLDVVFTYENKLFVIECKTGIDKETMLSETVYKAAALKNERLGKLSASTSIFSLSEENEQFKDIAKAMNITYYDKLFFIDKEKFKSIILDIDRKAKG